MTANLNMKDRIQQTKMSESKPCSMRTGRAINTHISGLYLDPRKEGKSDGRPDLGRQKSGIADKHSHEQ